VIILNLASCTKLFIAYSGSLTNNSFSETESEEETDANSNKIIWSHSEVSHFSV